MEQKKEDLRVRKTKRNIKKTLDALLQMKPLDKISVTEIARTAEINKGTFYLHYNDIYDLYNEFVHDIISDLISQIDFLPEFFTAPEEFLHKMLSQRNMGASSRYPYLFVPSRHNRIIPRIFTNTFRQHLYDTNIIEPSIDNDMKLEVLIHGMVLLVMEYGKEHPETIIRVMGQQIRQTFHNDLL